MIERSGSLATIDVAEGERVIVFGDIHGDLGALVRGLDLRRPRDYLVFLGDYADRGPDGIEVIDRIDTLLDRLPDRVVAIKGNHESYSVDGKPQFTPCTLTDEAARKRGSWEAYYPRFRRFVSRLCIAAIVPGRLLFVHGGVHSELRSVDRLISVSPKLESELMWSDPGDAPGLAPSPRGAGRLFGPDVSSEVCEALGVTRIVRSHEPRKALGGPAVEHEGRVVTTGTTTLYGGSAYALIFDPDMSVVEL